MSKTRPVVALPAIGLSAGFFSALFGVGGGVIVVPLLVLLLGYSTRWATGTSLAAIGLTSLFGMAAYGALGEVSWPDAALVGFPAMFGHLFRDLGAAEGADPRPHDPLQRPARGRRGAALHRMTVVYALVLGFTAGILSGMFGVGGGILFVPTLSLVVGLSHLSAEATSLAAIIPVVAVGAWQQNRYGNVRWRPALVIGLFSAGGVAGGVALATWLSEGVLERLFACLLLVVAARLAWSARR